ncbi:hypothetical protein [Prevotella sp.]|uniref:hypothetical protein n=1 Tax=Prevotella sp. TaxID=59823 RepID=UPI003AB26FDA
MQHCADSADGTIIQAATTMTILPAQSRRGAYAHYVMRHSTTPAAIRHIYSIVMPHDKRHKTAETGAQPQHKKS